MKLTDFIDELDDYTRLSKVGRESRFNEPFGNTDGERHAWCTGKLAGRMEFANEIRELCKQALTSKGAPRAPRQS